MNDSNKQSGQPEVYVKAVQFLESKGLSFQDFGIYAFANDELELDAPFHFQLGWVQNKNILTVRLVDQHIANASTQHEFTLDELPTFYKMAEMVIQASQWGIE